MKTWLLLKIVLTLTLASWNTSSQLLPVFDNDVKTSSGPVRGTQIMFHGRVVKQYLGIPFAKPPVGDLRFRRPQPVERSTKTLVADKMPPACIQYVEYPFPWYDFQDGKSEDCLYLNIWAPKSFFSLNAKMPVIFWIYGGGLTVGSNRKPIYDGRALAADGQVVVVTINYRMAAFGFLNSGTDSAPGNMGIYDILEALRWTKENIAAFGGDPDSITLAGESAGSIAIGLLSVSPLAKGLYKRVIMESGSPAYLSAENNTINIAQSQQLAEALGCANEDRSIYDNPEAVVSCLKDVDAIQIAKTLNSFHPTSTRSFFPNYGDDLLPRNAREELIRGNVNPADVLIGNNRDEGAFQITTGNPDVFGFFGEKDPQVNKTYGESLIREIFSSFDDPDAVIRHYLGNVSDDDYYRIREQVYSASGDYSLLCPTKYFAESYSKAGNRVYYYFFVHRPSTTPWAEWMGVVHYGEVQFVFGVPLQKPRYYKRDEIHLSKKIIKMWSNFARRGNPGRPNWPLYSRENPTYMELNTGRTSNYGQGPHESNCDFFRSYFGFNDV